MTSTSRSTAAAFKPTFTVLAACVLATLAACGGGSSSADSASATPAVTSDTSTDTSASAFDAATLTALASTEAIPAFHMAPAVLSEPSDADAGGTSVSANSAPQSFPVDASLSSVSTARLTPQALVDTINSRASVAAATSPKTATSITGAVYTPAQIRAAYGLSTLPAVGATLTSSQQAALGAGQTIYLIDAYHDVNALADLNRFSAKFGLPSCTNVSITTASTLASPPAASCTFSTVVATTSGGITTTVPSYNSTWASESKLDVQWAHAIAPLARIVLVEASSAAATNLFGAIQLADKLGAGVTSMSFGLAEASWTTQADQFFATSGMTYVAAAGDSGTQVNWPAVSTKVLATGGTGMQWNGSGTRYETTWSGTGGGVSAYVSVPTWQSGITLSGASAALTHRAVNDVSFNANPLTGQYVAVTAPNSTTTSWSAFGGTSMASPQWAGIVAVANAMRAAAGKARLGDFHTMLYKTVGAVSGTYASALKDIASGSDGACTTCTAATGFDQPTGWGTPNGSSMISVLVAN